jgi:hypothetical protein
MQYWRVGGLGFGAVLISKMKVLIGVPAQQLK